MPLLGRELELFPQDGLLLPEEQFPWHVAHTRSRQEKVLARYLVAREVPFYAPQFEKRVRRAGRSFVSFLPLFPGYVFFRGGSTERQAAIRSNLLVRVLEVRDQALLGQELARLRSLQASGAWITPYADDLVSGDPVRIVEGPFTGHSGVVLRGGHVRLIVSITMLRQSVAAEFERSALVPLKSAVSVRGESKSAVA